MPGHRKIADYLFYTGLFGLAASIPVSKAATSVGMFLMAIAWFVQWNWKEKIIVFKTNKKPIIFSAVLFLIFVLGLLHSENLTYGLKDLRIKAPIFILPVLFGVSFTIKRGHILIALSLMAASAIAATIIGFVNYQINLDADQVVNLRSLSPYISLIRLSLILTMAYGIALWGLVKITSYWKWMLLLPIGWIIFFFSFSESLTGLVFLPLVSLYFIIYLLKGFKRIAITVLLSFGILSVYFLREVYTISKMVFAEHILQEEERTLSGGRYTFNDNGGKENGYYVHRHVCHEELRKEWNKRSSVPYSSTQDKFQFNAKILRYLSSRGLKKDSVGISQLNNEEITAIEQGVTNAYYLKANPISKRIHQLFWEIDEAIRRGRYKGNSVTSRFIYSSTGIQVWKDHFFIGVGTGDVKDEMIKKYQLRPNYHEELFQKKSHNQYITIGVSIGVIGLLIFLSIYSYLFINYNGSLKYLFWLTQGIFIISMLWEDTIETQAGVAIFALWLNLFLFEQKDSIMFTNIHKN